MADALGEHDLCDERPVAMAPAHCLGLPGPSVRQPRTPDHPPPGWQPPTPEAAQKRMAILDALDDEIATKARKITELQNELGQLQRTLDKSQKKDKGTQTDGDKKPSHEVVPSKSSSWRPKPSRAREGQAAPTPKMLQAKPKAGASASSVLLGPGVPPARPAVIGARSGKDSR